MRNKFGRAAFCVVGLFAVGLTSARAQSVSTEEVHRKVKTKVIPVYPPLAKRTNLTGKVKMEAVIAADGQVKSTRALGGHPVLVEACQEAIKSWKFVAAQHESTEIIECNFTGSGN